MTQEKPQPATKPPHTIAVALDPEYHAYVERQAKEDDRTPAKWLKRYVQKTIDENGGPLFAAK